MKLHRRIASYILIGLGSLGLFGCDKDKSRNVHQEASKSEQQVYENQSNLRYIGRLGQGLQYSRGVQMRLGDIDGDGDLDIVLMSPAGKLFIYENTLPQKNQ